MPEQLSETLHFTKNWQQQLAEAFNNIENLCDYLNLPLNELPTSVNAAKNFSLRVPLSSQQLKQVYCTNIMVGFYLLIQEVAPLTAAIVSAATSLIKTFSSANKMKTMPSNLFMTTLI